MAMAGPPIAGFRAVGAFGEESRDPMQVCERDGKRHLGHFVKSVIVYTLF